MRHSMKTGAQLGFTLGIAVFVLAASGGVMPSDALAGEGVIPDRLENRLASNGTAQDHLAAALLYQQQAQQATTEAGKYERAAAAIGPLEDPKGFRRSGLITAAQTNQHYAGEMQQLYAAHQTKVETMLGKQQQ